MPENDVCFSFQPVDTPVESFDEVKIRLKEGGHPRWSGPCLIILVRVAKVGIATFSFGVPEGSQTGQVLWETTTPVWPPRSGSKRAAVMADVKRVICTYLSLFPDIGIAQEALDSVQDLGTFYNMTGSPPAQVHPRKLKSKSKRKARSTYRSRAARREGPQGFNPDKLALLRIVD